MPKYYNTISESTRLSQKTGSTLVVSSEFRIQSSTILSHCAFMQHLIQQIIYTTHGADLVRAKRALDNFPNPKARIEFLCSSPHQADDPVIERVFKFSRELFIEIYELRNVLAHELWSSSEDYPNYILFSKLDENDRLLRASGRLWHQEEATPQEVFDATVRFIRKVKLISPDHLRLAIHDAEVCNWCLLQIDILLTDTDPLRREKARQAFLVFRGTSHLFADMPVLSGPVEFSATRAKTIKDSG